MSLATPDPTRPEFHGTPRIARWRPLVQWLLAIPHLMIAYALDRGAGRADAVRVRHRAGHPAYSAAPFDAIAMPFRYYDRASSRPRTPQQVQSSDRPR